MERNQPEDIEPAGTDLRDVSPEARATRPEMAASAAVKRARQAELERSRQRLESIGTSVAPPRISDVFARICQYHKERGDRLASNEILAQSRFSSGSKGETFMELKCPKLNATYIYCAKGGKPLLTQANPTLGALMEEAPDISALYHVIELVEIEGEEGGWKEVEWKGEKEAIVLLKGIHRWGDEGE